MVYYILFAPTWKPEENPKNPINSKKPNVSETKWASNCADIVAENIVLIGFIGFFGFPRPGNCRPLRVLTMGVDQYMGSLEYSN